MAEQIGEAVVRISADTKPLETAVAQAKQATASLSGLKINWGEGQGSLEEYNSWVKKTNDEIANMVEESVDVEAILKREGVTIRNTAQEFSTLAQASTKTVQETSKLRDTLSTIGTALAHPIQTIKGAFARLKDDGSNAVSGIGDSFNGLTKTMTKTKRSITTWSFFLTAILGKSFSALAEVDEETKNVIDTIKNDANTAFANLGRILRPVLDFVGTIAEGFKMITEDIGRMIGVIHGVTETEDILTGVQMAEEYNKEATKNLAGSYDDLASSIANAQEQIADIRSQMDRTTLEYRRNLKQILVDHENTVNTLTQQIKDANDDYQRAVDERNAEFAVSQAKEEKEHQEKVDELMTQINFLQRYNNKYNQEKLSQLQFALAKENNLYKKQTEAEKAELDLQNKLEREKADKQIAEYQGELNEEIALLNKHRDLLNSVRDEILLDEVENLKEQYDLQMKSYNQQIAEAQKAGAQAGAKYAENYAKAVKDFDWNSVYKSVWSSSGYRQTSVEERNGQKVIVDTYIPGAFADGGYTGQGGKYEPAGIVHKGEYVIPKEQVDQTTGKPKAFGGVNVNITMNGAFATSATERRRFAEEIRNELANIDFARLGA